jgi:hypothetical protein
MRTEAEIRQKLKEVKEEGIQTGDFIKSSVTPMLIECCLLKWVLGEFEYPTKKEINEFFDRVMDND